MFNWLKKFNKDPLFPRQEWYLVKSDEYIAKEKRASIYERRWTERPSGPILNNVQASRGYEWRKAGEFK